MYPLNLCIFFKASKILPLNFLVGFPCSFLLLKFLGFLITIISVCRISELNALSITSSYLQFNAERVVLNLMVVLCSKSQLEFSVTVPVEKERGGSTTPEISILYLIILG